MEDSCGTGRSFGDVGRRLTRVTVDGDQWQCSVGDKQVGLLGWRRFRRHSTDGTVASDSGTGAHSSVRSSAAWVGTDCNEVGRPAGTAMELTEGENNG